MSSVPNIIKQSLMYYDASQPVIKYLYNNSYFTIYGPGSNHKRSKITFYDRTSGELIVETEIEILAVYYNKFRAWSWAWSHPGLRNSENYLSKEILRWALTIEPELMYIKSILTSSRGVVRDNIQIDINLAVGSSVIKQPYIYPYVNTDGKYDLIYYFILLNKSDLDSFSVKLASGKAVGDTAPSDIKKENVK